MLSNKACARHGRSDVNGCARNPLRRADPFLRSVVEDLVLPDGHGLLELVDERPGRLEGLAPMRARDRKHHREVADRELTDTMHDCRGDDGKPSSDRLRDGSELVHRSWMSGVVEPRHVSTTV